MVIATPDYGYYVAYLIIDHEINERFNPTKELKDCFYPLSHRDYPTFIKPQYNPSWLDMSRIREMESSRLQEEGILIGHLTARDLDFVMQALRDSAILSPKQKRRIGII